MSNTTIKFWRETGSGPVASTFAPSEAAEIVQVRFILSKSSGTHEALSAKHISAAGEIFNGHYFGQSMNHKTGVRTEEPLFIDRGDTIDFSYPNTDGVAWGLEVAYEVFGGAHAQDLPDSVPKSTKGAGRNGGASNG
jgi:hypothetical protein